MEQSWKYATFDATRVLDGSDATCASVLGTQGVNLRLPWPRPGTANTDFNLTVTGDRGWGRVGGDVGREGSFWGRGGRDRTRVGELRREASQAVGWWDLLGREKENGGEGRGGTASPPQVLQGNDTFRGGGSGGGARMIALWSLMSVVQPRVRQTQVKC